jgi:hypothetical protein
MSPLAGSITSARRSRSPLAVCPPSLWPSAEPSMQGPCLAQRSQPPHRAAQAHALRMIVSGTHASRRIAFVAGQAVHAKRDRTRDPSGQTGKWTRLQRDRSWNCDGGGGRSVAAGDSVAGPSPGRADGLLGADFLASFAHLTLTLCWESL